MSRPDHTLEPANGSLPARPGAMTVPGREWAGGLSVRLRTIPMGVLVLAALFGLVGVASVGVGMFLLLDVGSLSPWAGIVGLLIGPSVLYLAYGLVRLARWTWLSLAVLVGLLFVSSLIRLAASSGFPAAAIAELAVEVALLVYITRPDLRRAFGWGSAPA